MTFLEGEISARIQLRPASKGRRGNKMEEVRMKCPAGHGEMRIKKAKKKVIFRGVGVSVPVEQYVCTVCGAEAGTVDETAAIKQTISDTYRKAVNLMRGEEIVEKRKRLNLT